MMRARRGPKARGIVWLGVFGGLLSVIALLAPGDQSAFANQGDMTILAGGGLNDPPSGLARESNLVTPNGIGSDAMGNVFVTDEAHHRVLMVNGAGEIATVAGSGAPGFYVTLGSSPSPVHGEGGPATDSNLQELRGGIAVEPARGNFYFTARDRIRYVNRTSATVRVHGVDVEARAIRTVAGNGWYSDETLPGLPATAQGFAGPRGLALEPDGSLLIADTLNCTVKRLNNDGKIFRVAGFDAGGSPCGTPAEGAEAKSSKLGEPFDVARDADGNIFIATPTRRKVRWVEESSGKIRTFAGTGPIPGYVGDGREAAETQFNNPESVEVDIDGNVLIGDVQDCKIRKVSFVFPRLVSHFAGNGDCLADIGEGPALTTPINNPADLAFDSNGRYLYIASLPDPDPAITPEPLVLKIDITGPLTPIVNSLTPEFGPVTGGIPFTIQGDLLEQATVTFAGSPVSISPPARDKITGTVPPHLPPGVVPVAVSTPRGGLAANVRPFTYHPALTGLSRPSGRLEGGDTLTIYGQGFTEINQVRITTVPETVIPLSSPLPSDTEVTITTPPHPQGGEVRIFVTAYNLESIAVPAEANIFTYKNPTPQRTPDTTVTGVSSDSGGGLNVTPATPGTGTGFGVVPSSAAAPSALSSPSSALISNSVPASGSAQALDPSAAASGGGASVVSNPVPGAAGSPVQVPSARLQLGVQPVLGDMADSRPNAAPEYQMTGRSPAIPDPNFAVAIGALMLIGCFGLALRSTNTKDATPKYQPQRA